MTNSQEIKRSQNEFEEFWANYPRRVAKLAALKAFTKARRIATLEAIVAGVDRYVRSKPAWQAWAYPASWLNAGRWLDEDDAPRTKTTASDWWEECKQVHGGACGKRWDHECRMRTP